MDSAAIFNMQNSLADYNNVLENLNNPNFTATSNINENPNPEETTVNPDEDTIEFSRESLQLARIDTQPVVEEVFLAETERTPDLLLEPEVIETEIQA
jgi:hypothetical protein